LANNFGTKKEILVGMTPKDYAFPPGFNYDERSDQDGPI
jgi:hypothetical protein